MARSNKDHTVLPATHTFIHKWNESYLRCSAAAERHRIFCRY